MPTCTNCHHQKPEDPFKMCETCREKCRTHMKAWYLEHAKDVNSRNKAWRLAHPEQCRVTRKAWELTNAEHLRAYKKAWNLAHAEDIRARNRARYLAHAEEERAQHRARYLAHAEDVKSRSKAWMRAHPERTRARQKAWSLANPEKARASSARRRARKYASPTIETIHRMAIYIRDHGKCHICHRKVSAKAFHIDHLIPLSRGGPHTKQNVAVAHPACNLSRGAGRIPAQLRLLP